MTLTFLFGCMLGLLVCVMLLTLSINYHIKHMYRNSARDSARLKQFLDKQTEDQRRVVDFLRGEEERRDLAKKAYLMQRKGDYKFKNNPESGGYWGK